MFPGQGVDAAVLRSSGRNRDGDRELRYHHTVEGLVIDWTATRTLGSRGPGDNGRSQTAVADALGLAPPDSGLEAGDVLELPDGRRLRVVGVPAREEAPFDWYPGDEVLLAMERSSR